MTPEDAKTLRGLWGPHFIMVRHYEAMIRRYGNHPFFVARAAEQLSRLGAARVAERMLREVRGHFLANAGLLQGYLNLPLGQGEPGTSWYRG